MQYKPLGKTGLLVSELCLGTMTFGGQGELWSKIGKLDQGESDRLIATALDAGINFIDTADVYSEGRSEEITGQALRNLGVPRDEVVVATKVFGRTGSGPNGGGSSRQHILSGVKESLRRLQLDYIDLYQIHGVDPVTPIEETMEALDTLVRHGHVRYVGVSNWPAWRVAKAQGIAERRDSRGSSRFRPITPSSAATSSARSSRCWGPRAWASWSGARWQAACCRESTMGPVRRPTGAARASISRRSTGHACPVCLRRFARLPIVRMPRWPASPSPGSCTSPP